MCCMFGVCVLFVCLAGARHSLTRKKRTTQKKQAGEAKARHKVRLLGYTALGSFVFDFYKWFWQGADYACG